MGINREKLNQFVSADNSNWVQESKFRIENKAWLKRSAMIAVRILSALKDQDITQKELAEKMNVSSQYISKIVKGSENLSLETISKIESALNINLMTVSVFHSVQIHISPQKQITKPSITTVKDTSIFKKPCPNYYQKS